MTPVPSSLELKVGAQVMLMKNLNVTDGMVNGARGVVTSFDDKGRVSMLLSGFGGLGVARCLQVPKFAGSNPAEAVRIFMGEKSSSRPSSRREVKPWVPCRRFAACKRSLN